MGKRRNWQRAEKIVYEMNEWRDVENKKQILLVLVTVMFFFWEWDVIEYGNLELRSWLFLYCNLRTIEDDSHFYGCLGYENVLRSFNIFKSVLIGIQVNIYDLPTLNTLKSDNAIQKNKNN